MNSPSVGLKSCNARLLESTRRTLFAVNGHFRFTKGQPLGFSSSWPVFTLTHHVIVWLAAWNARPGKLFLDYAILGDDLVIADESIAKEYLRIMEECGVEISREKSLISSSGACEFAKRFRTDLGRVDLSPVSAKVLMLFGGFMPPFYYHDLGVSFQNSIRLRGGGYRAYSASEFVRENKSRKWFRHWLSFRYEALKRLFRGSSSSAFRLWVTLGSEGPVCPYRYGVVHNRLLYTLRPIDF